MKRNRFRKTSDTLNKTPSQQGALSLAPVPAGAGDGGGNGSSVSNQFTLDPNDPIPFNHGGKKIFAFTSDQYYLPFLNGADNFGKVLMEARLLSTTQNACISTKKDFLAGNEMRDFKGKEIDKRILTWFDSINAHDQSIIDIHGEVFESIGTFGNGPIEVVRFTVAGEKRLYVYAQNFLEWRLCPPDEDGIIREAVHSTRFLNDYTGFISGEALKDGKKLPIYSPRNTEKQNWLKDGDSERTLIWYKTKMVGYPHYGMPESISSLIYQVLEYKSARYNLDNFENNMIVSAILALKGNVSNAEAQKIAKAIIKAHTGDGKRGRVAVVASEEGKGISDSSFHQMTTTQDGSFIESDEAWSRKIVFANKWDSTLAGLENKAALGKGEGYLTKIYEVKQKSVIQPSQEKYLRNVWNHIFKIGKDWLGLPFDQYDFIIHSNALITSVSDVDVTPVVTVDEVREANNMTAHPDPVKGKLMLSELSVNQKKAENVPVK